MEALEKTLCTTSNEPKTTMADENSYPTNASTESFRLNGSASTVKSRKRKFSMKLSSQSFQNRSPIAGEFAFERIARGKNGLSKVPDGLRQGVNDFTGWFCERPQHEGQPTLDMAAPAPPWNNSVVLHPYTLRFTRSTWLSSK